MLERFRIWRERNYTWAHWLWCFLVVGGALAFDLWRDDLSVTDVGVDDGVLTAAAGVFGALLGFGITTLAIVLGYAGDDRLKRIREQEDHWRLLWVTLFAGTKALAVATVLGLFGPVFFPTSNTIVDSIFLYAFAFACLFSILRTARIIWILRYVTEIIAGVTFKKVTMKDVAKAIGS